MEDKIMKRAVSVKPLDNYLLLIKFDNGDGKVFNCYLLLSNPLFKEIFEESFFKTVHIDEMGMVCWNDATDINPFYLYDNSESVSNFAFAV